MRNLILLTLAFVSTFTFAEQICRQSSPLTKPNAAMRIAGDGTVIDAANKLQWQRCPLGMSGADCQGQAQRLTHMAALDKVLSLNRSGYAGHHDWRLPTPRELTTLVSHACVNPAIDLALFPNTPVIWYWTSSSEGGGGWASWYVDFAIGQTGLDDKNLPNAVRLVRSLGDDIKP